MIGPHFTFVPMSTLQDLHSSPDARWVTLAPSSFQFGLTMAIASAAIVLLALVAMAENTWMPPAVTWLLSAGLAMGAAWELVQQRHSPPQRVIALYLLDIDAAVRGEPPVLGVRLRFADAREAEGVVMTPAFVMPWFTTIRYRLPGDARWRRWWPRVLPLWRDALDRDAFRAIRVKLKWKPPH
jgi:hypothetical protein